MSYDGPRFPSLTPAIKQLLLVNAAVFFLNALLLGRLSAPTEGGGGYWFAFSWSLSLDGFGLGALPRAVHGESREGVRPPGEVDGPLVGLVELARPQRDAVEEELRRGRETPGPETTPNARLACIYAANATMEVVDSIHNTAGTSAMRMDNPLERKLRDSRGAATHRWTSHSLYPELGKIYMGQDGSPEFLGTGQPGFG